MPTIRPELRAIAERVNAHVGVADADPSSLSLSEVNAAIASHVSADPGRSLYSADDFTKLKELRTDLQRASGNKIGLAAPRTGGATLRPSAPVEGSEERLRTRVTGLERELGEAGGRLTAARAQLTTARQELTTARGTTSFADRNLGWLGLGSDAHRNTVAAAERRVTQCEANVRSAEGSVTSLKGRIDTTLRDHLRATSSEFAAIETRHREAGTALQSATGFYDAVDNAVRKIDAAISAKAWDNLGDSMNDRNHQPDLLDALSNVSVSLARSSAQSAIDQVKGALPGFKAAMERYGADSVGADLRGVSVGPGLFDYFTQDDAFVGFFNVLNMSNAKSKLAELRGRVDGVKSHLANEASKLGRDANTEVANLRRSLD